MDAAVHREMDALQPHGAQEPGGVADDQGPVEVAPGNGVPAALGQRLGAVAGHLAAGEEAGHEGVLLEPLKGHVGIEAGVPVVEPHHEPDRHAPLRQHVDEAPAELLAPQRIAQRVHDGARGLALRRNLPELLDAESVGLRRRRVEPVPANERLGEVAPDPVGEDGDGGPDVDAGFEGALRPALLVEAAVAGPHPDHPVALVQHLRPREPREHVDALRLGLLREPADEAVEGDDVVPVVPQGRRGDGGPEPRLRGQVVDAVLPHRRLDRRPPLLPVRQQGVEAGRVEHRPRQHVGAALARLLEHRDGEGLASFLLLQAGEADGRRQAGRTAADDQDVDLEGFALHQASRAAMIAGTTSKRSPTMP